MYKLTALPRVLLTLPLLILVATINSIAQDDNVTPANARKTYFPGRCRAGYTITRIDQTPGQNVYVCGDNNDWNLIGGSIAAPAGSNGDIQTKSGTSLGAGGINDNGTTINIPSRTVTIGTTLPGGAPTGTVGASVVYSPNSQLNVKAFGVTGNAKFSYGAVTTTPNTVTCADCVFTSADVGKVIWGVFDATKTLYVPKGTITAVASGTSITVSTTVTAGVGIRLVWGTDDTTALKAAAAAAKSSLLSVYVPAGGYIFTKLIFDFRMSPAGPTPQIVGDGSKVSVFYPSPDYDFSTTSANNGLLTAYAQATSGGITGIGVNGASYAFLSGSTTQWMIDASIAPGRVTDVFIRNVYGLQSCFGAQSAYLVMSSVRGLFCGSSFQAATIYLNQGSYITTDVGSSNGYGVRIVGINGAAGQFVNWTNTINDEGGIPNISIESSTDVFISGAKLFSQAGQNAMNIDGTSVVRMSNTIVGPWDVNANAGGITVQSGGVLYLSESRLYSSGTGVALVNSGTTYDLGGNSIQNTSGNAAVTTFSRVGIGTASPLTELNVLSTSTSSPRGILSQQVTSDTLSARFGCAKARGTPSALATVVSGDLVCRMVARPFDGTNFLEMGAIEIGTSGTVATGRTPTFMAFSTATNASPSVLTEAARIDSAGNFMIGTTTPAGMLTIGSSAGQLIVDSAGNVTFGSNSGLLSQFSDISAGSGRTIGWGGGSFATLRSPSNGVLNLTNVNGVGFNRLQFGGTGATIPAFTTTVQTNPVISVTDATGGGTANFAVPAQKSTTGQRYVCIDTNGQLVSSASACSGT